MATTSSTTKAKPDNQNLTRSRSLGRKPKLPSSTASSEDGSDLKPEKPLPNYLKPTISSRPDPVKFLKKNNNTPDDNQKLLRRRSFDRPPSSLTSPSTSFSPRNPKSLNVSPSRPRDRPAVPREKPVAGLRSSSFHGSRSGPRGGTNVKSPPVAPKKSGLSSGNTSLKSKKEGSENVTRNKASDKEITLDSASLSSAQEEDDDILKVESDLQVSPHDIGEQKDEKEDEEVQVEAVQADQYSCEEKIETSGQTMVASTVEDDSIAVIKEVEEKLTNEDKLEEKSEETKEEENSKGEDEEEFKKTIDEDDGHEKVDINMKEVESVEDNTKEKEEENGVKEEEKVKEDEKKEEKMEEEEKVKKDEKEEEKVKEDEKEEEEVKEEKVKEDEQVEEEVKEEEKVKEDEREEEKVKEEEKAKVKEGEMVKKEDSGEGKKREVVKRKKESPSAYNDVIASKMQENPRKNKVLALAGAFQTVIDYETAASK